MHIFQILHWCNMEIEVNSSPKESIWNWWEIKGGNGWLQVRQKSRELFLSVWIWVGADPILLPRWPSPSATGVGHHLDMRVSHRNQSFWWNSFRHVDVMLLGICGVRLPRHKLHVQHMKSCVLVLFLLETISFHPSSTKVSYLRYTGLLKRHIHVPV